MADNFETINVSVISVKEWGRILYAIGRMEQYDVISNPPIWDKSYDAKRIASVLGWDKIDTECICGSMVKVGLLKEQDGKYSIITD